MAIIFFSSDASGEQVRKNLQTELPDLPIWNWQETDTATRQSARYAIAWNPPDDFFDGLDNLQAIFSVAAGVDHLLDHPSLPPEVPLARLEDAGMADKIAEYVLYGVLHAQRSFDHYRSKQALQEWDNSDREVHAADTTVGILGLGTIGRVVAKRLVSNNYHVKGWSRSQKTVEGIDFHAGTEGLPGFLDNLDTLVCLLPLTPDTHGIINKQLLEQLANGTFLINAARGKHVDTAALLEALESGKLRGALLDVTDPEPLPGNHPLWSHPAVLITPHVAGPTQMQESVRQIAANIKRAEAGSELTGLVDRVRGY